MKLLICTRMNRTTEETNAMYEARERIVNASDEVTVHLDENLDWNHLREISGDYGGAYRWAAKAYDVIVVIEAPGGTLARGQFTIADFALTFGKTVNVWRDGRGWKVRRVERIAAGKDWKKAYGKAIV